MNKKVEKWLARLLFIILMIIIFLMTFFVPPLYGQDIRKKHDIEATIHIDEDSLSVTQIHQLQNILLVLKERYNIKANLFLLPEEEYKSSIHYYNYKYIPDIVSDKFEVKKEEVIGTYYVQKKRQYWQANDMIRATFLDNINRR